MSYSVVWFKRDLRIADHAALEAAARDGPVLCLYNVKPSLWAQPDAAPQHYEFIIEALRDVYRALRNLGGLAESPFPVPMVELESGKSSRHGIPPAGSSMSDCYFYLSRTELSPLFSKVF